MSLNLGIIASSRATAPSAALLLDTYTGAAAAYSLRKLRTAYTGAAIRVRRSSDNTETDIGFVADVLDISSLITFVGAGNGFVTKWYDQSGNAKDSTQTIQSNQPKIVNTGSIILKNTKPTVYFLNPQYLNLSSNFTGTAGTFINLTATTTDPAVTDNGSPMSGIGNQSLSSHQPYSDGNIYETFATSVRKTVGNPTNNTTNLYLYNVVSDSNLYNVKINNSTFYNTTTNTVQYNTNPPGTFFPKIGTGVSIGGLYYFNGYISEIIVYTSNQTSNISAINSNINSYYTIY